MNSNKWRTGSGTRQGGAISALIFSFYINDMIKEVNQFNIGRGFGYHSFKSKYYTDDLQSLAPYAKGLLELVEYTNEKLKSLCLMFIVPKCCFIVFRKPVRFENNLQIMLQGRELNRVASCKYLGVIFSDVLTYDLDIYRATNAFTKQFTGLCCKFNYLDGETLSYLFRTYTSSFNGIESWFYYIYEKEKSLQNRCRLSQSCKKYIFS